MTILLIVFVIVLLGSLAIFGKGLTSLIVDVVMLISLPLAVDKSKFCCCRSSEPVKDSWAL